MSVSPERRRFLPILNRRRHGNRSTMTCLYRCGNACDHPVPNTSDNPYLPDMIATAVSRRGVFKAGVLGALVIGTGSVASAAVPEAPATVPTTGHTRGDGSLRFFPVPPNTLDTVVVPNGYDHRVVIQWGDEVVPGAPRFDINRQPARAQQQQFGYNNDFVAVLPLDRHFERALLVVNHEYTNENLMFPDFTSLENMSIEQIRIAMAAHGMSVVELERADRDSPEWVVKRRGDRRYNRRIHLGTQFELTGPAAGSRLLQTAADRTGRVVLGTMNNCAGGVTPWGTILSGEENFNQYFANGSRTTDRRYGVGSGSTERKWERFDKRFDLAQEPNEVHRFGYVVELDPYDPTSTPRKHTALGRFKHEGATVRLTHDGRPVVYSGDDERFEYFYKFVGSKRMRHGTSRSAREHNLTLLDEGTLYVARLTGDSPAPEIDGSGKLPEDGEFDGSGEWIPLATATADGAVSHVEGMTAEEVFVFTRLAADKVGATKMDRPEDVEPNPVTGKVYVALTNNSRRGVDSNPAADEANPRNANKHGHVLELTERWNRPESTRFAWSLFLVAGDPKDPSTYFAGFPKDSVSPISCPDNVAFDAHGNLWIATDGNALGSNDGLFAVPVTGPERGRVRQFLTVPRGAETCGPLITDDQLSVFVAVQHPGEISGANPDNPASRWPDGDQPRPSVVVAWHPRGKRIGS